MQCAVSLNQMKRRCPLFMTLHELERAEEADGNEDDNSKNQNEGKERARRDEPDDDELAQCPSRLRRGGIPFAMVRIQSGQICYTVIVALLQIASRTATKVLSPKY